MEGKKAEELNALEAFLREDDAVMELSILSVLRRYISDRGNPATVVELLSDNYQGFAHMASLVVQWTSQLHEDSDVHQDPSLPANVDESYFLRELAQQRFDPEKFAGIFTSGGGGPPRWLHGNNGLLADKAGRQLIYSLSQKHRNSLVLNYAIQRILQAGHEDEVANLGSSLASYFSVFHRLLTNRLKQVPQADAALLQSLAAELKETCCQGQHTHLHAQLLLTQLGRLPGGARFRRLAQELEAHAAKLHGAIAWQMHFWLLDGELDEDTREAELAIMQLLEATEPAQCKRAADGSWLPPQGSTLGATHAPWQAILRLHTLYSSPSSPPMSLIRHPQVIKRLLVSLCGSGTELGQPEARACRALLALAAAALDRRPGGALDLADVADVERALRDAGAVVAAAMKGAKFGPTEQAQAQSAASCAMAAACMLQAIGSAMSRAQFWRSYIGPAMPHLITVLALIIPRQPQLAAKVVKVISGALKALGNHNAGISKVLIELYVAMLASGEVATVLSSAEHWAKTADPSMVRFFVYCVLSAVEPPYSAHFAASLIRLMQVGAVKRSRVNVRDGLSVQQLEDFAAACRDVKFRPPLSDKQAALLRELQPERTMLPVM